MPVNPLYNMPPNVPVDEDMKRSALSNALMQFAVAITQPQQGRNSTQKFLNAVPAALQQGMGGYNQSLLGSTNVRQEYDKSVADLAHTNAQTKHLDANTQKAEYEMQGVKQRQEFLNSILTLNVINPDGTTTPLPKFAADNSNVPESIYQKDPELLMKFFENNINKTQGVMVDWTSPDGTVKPYKLDDAVKLKQLYPEVNETPKNEWDFFYGNEAKKGTSPDEIWNKWNNTKTERAAAVGSAGALAGAKARAQVDQETPMNPSEIADLVDPNTFAPAKMGMTKSEAAARGYIKIDQQARKDYFNLENSKAILDGLIKLSDNLMTAKNPVQAGLQAAKLHAGALTKSIPDAAVYKDTKQAFTGIISKTLGGQSGVLTDRDLLIIDKAFAAFGDTVEIKNRKNAILKNIYEIAKKAKKKQILGENFEVEQIAISKWLDKLDTPDTVPEPKEQTQSAPNNIKRSSDGFIEYDSTGKRK